MTTKTNGLTEYRNDHNDRGAVATLDGYTIFGFWENGVLRCAYGKPSKHYKNPARAAAKWMAA
jgi:hypothetical protein|tara:strand:- start:467 stop:655 length:189 start_codon:yes stop_codon:yes gene_type:complete